MYIFFLLDFGQRVNGSINNIAKNPISLVKVLAGLTCYTECQMIVYTKRLDSALRKTAWAHEKTGQHRKGTDIPYIIHPVGVMMIASNVSDDEDVLIACLLHDVLEDVDSGIYDEEQMRQDFGNRVVQIVKDVSKDDTITDWHDSARAYLHHLEFKASDEAVVVSTSDKIHNLISILIDYSEHGERLWDRFKTKNSADQLWWYESILAIIKKRKAPDKLVAQLTEQVNVLAKRLMK